MPRAAATLEGDRQWPQRVASTGQRVRSAGAPVDAPRGISPSVASLARYEAMVSTLSEKVARQQREIDNLKAALASSTSGKGKDGGASSSNSTTTPTVVPSDASKVTTSGDTTTCELPLSWQDKVDVIVRQRFERYADFIDNAVARRLAERLHRVTHDHIQMSVSTELKRVLHSSFYQGGVEERTGSPSRADWLSLLQKAPFDTKQPQRGDVSRRHRRPQRSPPRDDVLPRASSAVCHASPPSPTPTTTTASSILSPLTPHPRTAPVACTTKHADDRRSEGLSRSMEVDSDTTTSIPAARTDVPPQPITHVKRVNRSQLYPLPTATTHAINASVDSTGVTSSASEALVAANQDLLERVRALCRHLDATEAIPVSTPSDNSRF